MKTFLFLFLRLFFIVIFIYYLYFYLFYFTKDPFPFNCAIETFLPKSLAYLFTVRVQRE